MDLNLKNYGLLALGFEMNNRMFHLKSSLDIELDILYMFDRCYITLRSLALSLTFSLE